MPNKDHTDLEQEPENRKLAPMEAADVIYSEGDAELTEALLESLGEHIFYRDLPKPSSKIRRMLARGIVRLLHRTTRTETGTAADGSEFVSYRNRILERSEHPYAQTLLGPSGADPTSFVEGGNPMNAPYMMIAPEVRRHAETWDKLFLDSVQAKDVQIRLIREARFTYQLAKRHLDGGEPLRMKSVAAGTGLSMIMVFDRLLKDGYDPSLITASITDRDPANVAAAHRLLNKLPTTRERIATEPGALGIGASVEDALAPTSPQADEEHHIVTLVGILEYFPGYTCATSADLLDGRSSGDGPHAIDLLSKIMPMLAETGTLIANSYRLEPGARILEIFGKNLFYRNRENLVELAGAAGFTATDLAGAGNIYDVIAFEKGAKEAKPEC